MGPLHGFKLVEIAGIGPTQLTGMLLADMGAQIIRIGREGSELGLNLPAHLDLMNRSRPTVAVDLKRAEGVELVLGLCETADGLFEGFRPGVMERLGLGPNACLERNPELVYGRMTGWGQDGPLAQAAGHDGNYVALTGVLASIGEKNRAPVYPLNLIGDFGGGALYLVMGLLAGLLETSRSGQGQVVDAAIVDGAASMMTMFYGLMAGGMWREERGVNAFDGSAPFAGAYRTKDDQYVMVSPIERRFYAELLTRLGLDDIDPSQQMDPSTWSETRARIAAVFESKTRAEWIELLEGTDACFAPVLSLTEATQHPHNVARGTYVEVDGITQPAPAPRFSRSGQAIKHGPRGPGAGAREALAAWGLGDAEIDTLLAEGIVS